jgi:AraC-like DNA-binding protein
MEAQRFSSGGEPEARRPRAFESTLSNLFSVDLAVSPTNDKPFVSEMLAYRSGRLHVARLGFSPHRTFFAGAARTRASNLLVSVHREGEVEVSQNDRDARVAPGDIFVIDPSRPFEIQTGEIDTYSIYLPRARLRQISPHLESMTASPIPTDHGPGAVFRTLLETVFKAAPDLSDEAADQLADAFPPALAAAMGAAGEAEILPSRIKLMHRHRIRRFALDNLHDPQLDIDRVAHGVGLSARYLHELFRDQPASLMKWIWTARLERCREELADPGRRSLPIGEIAYGWGFTDLAHFSRAFRQHYGRSPRQYRRGDA